MGFLDFLKARKEEAKEGAESAETCSYCNKAGADKHFGGMPWHRKCLRMARKQAKGMI